MEFFSKQEVYPIELSGCSSHTSACVAETGSAPCTLVCFRVSLGFSHSSGGLGTCSGRVIANIPLGGRGMKASVPSPSIVSSAARSLEILCPCNAAARQKAMSKPSHMCRGSKPADVQATQISGSAVVAGDTYPNVLEACSQNLLSNPV